MKKYLLTTLAALMLVCAVAPHAFAATGDLSYTPLEPIPGVNQTSSGIPDLGQLISAFFKIFITLGAFLAVGMLVFGGISYMLSDAGAKLEEAKHRIQAALWGMLLLLSSYLILNTINPQLVNFTVIFNPTPGTSAGNPTPNPAGTQTQLSGSTQEMTVANNDPNRSAEINSFCPTGTASFGPDPAPGYSTVICTQQ